MPIELNHVGIAVQDPTKMKQFFQAIGLKEEGTELVQEQGVMTHFLKPQNSQPPQIELLEVKDSQGTVAQFISKRGEGVHHLSFLVGEGELDPLCEKLKKEQYRLIYDSPRAGAHGMRINFVHPTSTGGVLVELMERSSS